MKALRLVLITSVCVMLTLAARAQVKIGENKLLSSQHHWLEIDKTDSLFIITNDLSIGLTDKDHRTLAPNPSMDAIMLKLYGYGFDRFLPQKMAPFLQDSIDIGGTNSKIFAGITTDGQLLEVPLRLVLQIQNTTQADLSFHNGADTFGTVDLLPLIGSNTFYLADGALDEDRTVDGATNTLTFNNLDSFEVATSSFIVLNGDQTAIQQGGQDIIQINGNEDVKFRSTGVDSIMHLDSAGSITISQYGDSSIVGTFTTILAVDINGNVIEVGPEGILGTQTDSVIYRHNGTLIDNRTLGGAGLYDLTFSGLDTFNVAGNGFDVDATDVDMDGTSLTADYVTINTAASGVNSTSGLSMNVTSTGGNATITANGGDVVVDATSNTVDINTPDVILSDTLQMESYGDSMIVGTFTTILAVDINGKVIEVGPEGILGTQTDSVIYRHNGTLIDNRTLGGAGLYDLTFSGLDTFNVAGNGFDVDATDVDMDGTSLTADYVTINTAASGVNSTSGLSMNVTSTGGNATITANGGDVVVDATSNTVDINTPDVILSDTLQMESYGDSMIVGTFTTILAVDINGKVIEVGPEGILGTQTDSVIYRHNGTLIDNRTLGGAGLYDLTFSGLDTFNVAGNGFDVDATDVDMDGTSLTADYVTINTAASGVNSTSGLSMNVTSTGGNATITANGGDVVVDATSNTVDINTPDVILSDTLQMESYGDSMIVGTFTTILAVDINGKVIEVGPEGILGTQTDSVIYRHNGTLIDNRTLGGAGLYDLTFSGLDTFNVAGNGFDVDATDVDMDGTSLTADYVTINTAASGVNSTSGLSMNVTSTGGNATITANGGDVVVDATSNTVDINTPDVILSDTLQMESYGDSMIVGTFTTILAVDINGKVIEVGPEGILGTQTDSVIYRHNGTLIDNRTLGGAGLYDLTFSGLDTFNVAGNGFDVDATDVDMDGTSLTADYVTINTAASGVNSTSGLSMNVTSTGGNATITANGGDVVVDATSNTVDINTPDVILSDTLQMESYGDSMIVGTFTTILAVDINGKVIEVGPEGILGTQTDSVIYRHNGTLIDNRTLGGAGLYDLTFSGLDTFNVAGNGFDVDATDVDMDGTSLTADYVTINTAASGVNSTSGLSMNVTSTGGNATITANGGDVVVDATSNTVDINTPDVILSDTLQMESYGDSMIVGTFTTILAVDINGKVIEVGPEGILGTETDSVIYRHNGTLIDDRTMTMGPSGTGYDLMFVSEDGADTTIITNDGRIGIGTGVVTQGTGTSEDIRLDVNGDILAIQVHSSSDERFKRNISQVTNALDKVRAINGVTYKFRTEEFNKRNFPKTTQIGFIAQNVEKVLPEVVKTDAAGYKSVDYAKITALLNEAIKEQQEIIENLTKELGTAKENNAEMANEIASIKQMIKEISNLAVSDED